MVIYNILFFCVFLFSSAFGMDKYNSIVPAIISLEVAKTIDPETKLVPCGFTPDRRLVSLETGVEYVLTKDQLSTIKNDYEQNQDPFSRYFVKTTLQKDKDVILTFLLKTLGDSHAEISMSKEIMKNVLLDLLSRDQIQHAHASIFRLVTINNEEYSLCGVTKEKPTGHCFKGTLKNRCIVLNEQQEVDAEGLEYEVNFSITPQEFRQIYFNQIDPTDGYRVKNCYAIFGKFGSNRRFAVELSCEPQDQETEFYSVYKDKQIGLEKEVDHTEIKSQPQSSWKKQVLVKGGISMMLCAFIFLLYKHQSELMATLWQK